MESGGYSGNPYERTAGISNIYSTFGNPSTTISTAQAITRAVIGSSRSSDFGRLALCLYGL